MVFALHRGVALAIVAQLEGHPDTPFWGAAAACARSLVDTMGFDPPLEPNEMEPGIARGGWQHEAASRVERHFRQEVLFERMGSRDRRFFGHKVVLVLGWH